MFTRSSTVEPKTLEPVPPQPPVRRAAPPVTPETSSSKSVIGKDLRIIGQGLKIISQGTITVEGEVEGDVRGNEVIISDTGKVTGMVAADRVIVRGTVAGVIRGSTVALQASSKVTGDVHHMSLSIEQGAEFDGRCRRLGEESELNLDGSAPTTQKNGGAIPLPRAM